MLALPNGRGTHVQIPASGDLAIAHFDHAVMGRLLSPERESSPPLGSFQGAAGFLAFRVAAAQPEQREQREEPCEEPRRHLG